MKQAVAFFLVSLERGGIERSLNNLLGELCGEFEIDLVVGSISDVYRRRVPPTVRVLTLLDEPSSGLGRRALQVLPPRIQKAMRLIPLLSRYLREHPETTVLAFQGGLALVLARYLARMMGGHVGQALIRESSTVSAAARNGGWAGRLSLLGKGWAYRRADGLVAISQGAARDLVRTLGVDSSKVCMIYNGIVNDELVARAREAVDHPWLAESRTVPVLVAVARHDFLSKDFPTLLAAFGQLRRRQQLRLILVGAGHHESRLRRMISDLRLEDSVLLWGFDANPARLVARADAFVFVSIFEGLGNALVEAAALGVPCIATDCPNGPREILVDGKGGWLVPVGDAERLAQAIEACLADPSVARARADVAQSESHRFDVGTAARAYAELLQTVGCRSNTAVPHSLGINCAEKSNS